MTKPRRKSQIRQAAAQQVQALGQSRAEHRDWRILFFEAIVAGASVTAAARVAGISRARVYTERLRPDFDHAWCRAQYWREMGFRHISEPIWPPRGTVICGTAAKSPQRRDQTVQR